MSKIFYYDKSNDDWIIVDSIDTKPFLKVVKEAIKTAPLMSIKYKSTTGKNAKQYDLLKYLEHNPIVDKIKEKILFNLKKHFNLKTYGLDLLSAWTVLGYKNTYHTLHRHNTTKQNHVSSVLYLKTPKSKKNNFYYLHKNNGEIDLKRLNPKEGDLFIFPVWLWHGVYPQLEKGLRQTLNIDFGVRY